MNLATCVVCGCTDLCACPLGCAWVRVDRRAGKGVCTSCEHTEKGQRWLRARPLGCLKGPKKIRAHS